MNEKALAPAAPENGAAPVTRRHVEKLFRRLAAFYTTRWSTTASKPGMHEEMIAAWLEELEGLSPDHLAFGATRLRRYPDWPPTPARFRELCLPTAEESGYPDVHRAYRMATGADTSPMPAIVWATREEVGAWKLGHRPEHETFPLFERAYNANVAAAVAGEKKFCYPKPVEPARRVEGPKRGPQPKTAAGQAGMADAKAAVEAMKPQWLSPLEMSRFLGIELAEFDRLLLELGLATGFDIVGPTLTRAGKRCVKTEEGGPVRPVRWNPDAVKARIAFNRILARDDKSPAGLSADGTPGGAPVGPRKFEDFANKAGFFCRQA